MSTSTERIFLGCPVTGDLPINVHSRPPDRSPDAVETRCKAAEQARAANVRQAYVHDPVLEAATARYVAGDITREEYRALMIELATEQPPTKENYRLGPGGARLLVSLRGGRAPQDVQKNRLRN